MSRGIPLLDGENKINEALTIFTRNILPKSGQLFMEKKTLALWGISFSFFYSRFFVGSLSKITEQYDTVVIDVVGGLEGVKNILDPLAYLRRVRISYFAGTVWWQKSNLAITLSEQDEPYWRCE